MDFLAFLPIVKEIIGLFPSEQKRQELLTKVQDIEAQIAQGQLKVNEAEASNASLFVSGWRPFIGWVCGLGLVYSYVGPLLGGPVVDLNALIAILSGMLGLGTLRTVEKVKGVSRG